MLWVALSGLPPNTVVSTCCVQETHSVSFLERSFETQQSFVENYTFKV